MTTETTATNEAVNLKKEGKAQISEVDKALEELKEELTLKQTCAESGKIITALSDGLFRLHDKAQNLVNAIEREKCKQ